MSKVLANRYELFERVGEGGMSVVYKAKDRLLNRFVAIKILKPEFISDQKFIESFRRESQNAASMSHPNIVNIYDVGREGNIHYIVMELIEGRALSDYIREQGPMAYPKVIALSKQIASALAFAHKNHIIHRDVKPHNVMITPNGTAKITDFGIAKAVNAATIVDNTDGIVGSVHYFSPEQARGGYVDEKSDIYSLGIVMYEMLTGQVPFDGDNPVNIALQHINSEMTPPSKLVDGVPPALEHIIMKCCDKYPVNRYASADDLIEALNNLEFVGSVVGNSVLMGSGTGRETTRIRPQKNKGPIAGNPDYDSGEDEEYEEPEGRKKKEKNKKNNKRIILIAAIAAAVILALIAVLHFIGGEEIEAPDFKGMTMQQAQDMAEQMDIKVKEGEEVISDEVDKGLIVSQTPEPGQTIKTGSTVTVNISKGLGDGSVPDLTGKMKDDLSEYLEAAGFKLGAVTTKSSDQPEGTVLSQNPKAGSEVEKGTAIDVVVSDGSKAKATVPYLVGKSLSEAQGELAAAGLSAGKVSYDYSSSYAEGEVMWQQYDAGAMIDKKSSVKLRVSKGPAPTTTTTTTAPAPTEPELDGPADGN
ncbi:MAG: Stk1 family PASTA domain-containing Ser/Thr kinase [Firmicutes bacterium]|nr:Stk1 family PASTA domain-containing Ser/Thr kinase [Bacillota bacterium]